MTAHDDDDKVLQDGGRRTVPMMLKDSTGRDTGDVVQIEPWQRDTIWAARFGLNDAADLYRNGSRYCTDEAARARVEQARAEGIADMCNAWKNPPPVADVRGQQPGDVCTVRGPEYPNDFGSPGHLDARLVCVPDNPRRQDSRPHTMDAATAQRIRDEAWLASVKELESAWQRKP
jgi:hypothetical protein